MIQNYEIEPQLNQQHHLNNCSYFQWLVIETISGRASPKSSTTLILFTRIQHFSIACTHLFCFCCNLLSHKEQLSMKSWLIFWWECFEKVILMSSYFSLTNSQSIPSYDFLLLNESNVSNKSCISSPVHTIFLESSTQTFFLGGYFANYYYYNCKFLSFSWKVFKSKMCFYLTISLSDFLLKSKYKGMLEI